jgi:hypothetical protein
MDLTQVSESRRTYLEILCGWTAAGMAKLSRFISLRR